MVILTAPLSFITSSPDEVCSACKGFADFQRSKKWTIFEVSVHQNSASRSKQGGESSGPISMVPSLLLTTAGTQLPGCVDGGNSSMFVILPV